MLGLVLEGGANRTYYTIGILDAFLESGIEVDMMVGVSAGIANGLSYISRQKGRGLELGLKYIPDKRYMGFKYFLKKGNGSYYNREFIFNEIPNKVLPFDYEEFNRFPGDVYAVVANLESGKTEYIKIESTDVSWTVVQASCALPFMFKPIQIGDNKYFDGGCTDPLPVKFAFDKGCDKVITITTRELSYTKETEGEVNLSAFMYRKNKAFADALRVRSSVYNTSRDYLFTKEKEGKAFVFAPKNTSGWKRTEKIPSKLKEMYDEGYRDALSKMADLKLFINS